MDSQDGQENTLTDHRCGPARAADQGERAQNMPVGHGEEFLAYRRLKQDLPTATSFNLGDDRLRHIPVGDQDSGWQNCFNSVEKYDRELCQAYREQIDTLLVFAGLFSAVVTAFAVESYQWLQDDPTETSVELLRDVVRLLSQNSNLTVPSTPIAVQRLSTSAIVRINSFWFLSLTLSLTAALVGILCKQWLREFERNVGQSPETALAVRYVRFHGLEYWGVGSIVTSMPIILQIALGFFVVGIIELLWRLHAVVACCVSVVAGITLAFYLATTLLPVIQYVYICMRCYAIPLRARDYAVRWAFTEPQCAFKSAQAWIAFRVARPLFDHILKAYGYGFSSHHPPISTRRILRTAESWVDFDMNWVQCRQNIHAGPRCAFESLTWIARNLREMHMSSWIWHCVWAQWLKNREPPNDLAFATMEIQAVARSYPRMVALDNNNTPLARSQALIFQCSLWTDLPVNVALELLLRVAPVVGANSQWTSDALHAVRGMYHDLYFRMSDDIAIGLFHLAELQTHDILFKPDGPNSANPENGAFAFREIAILLNRGTHLRTILIPAMSGLVLQWLRSRPPSIVARVARQIFEDMIWFLVSQGYRGVQVQNLRHRRGIMFIAKLARAVADLWPIFAAREAYEHEPDIRAVLRELLAIFADGLPELAQSGADGGVDQRLGADDSALGERSVPPQPDAHTGEETHTVRSDPLDDKSEACQPSPATHLGIDVHADDEEDAERGGIDVNTPASPADSSATPTAPLGTPVSEAVPISPESL